MYKISSLDLIHVTLNKLPKKKMREYLGLKRYGGSENLDMVKRKISKCSPIELCPYYLNKLIITAE